MINDATRIIEKRTKRLRKHFLPADVRLLFVGESPPANGEFFYQGGTRMTAYTRRAFEHAFSRPFESDREFLDFFRSSGCWLDDVCWSAVNRLSPRERTARVRDGLRQFATRVRKCSPNEIVVVLRRILPVVREALDQAEIRVPVHSLPFPGYHWQSRYENELVSILTHGRRQGLFLIR